MSEKWQSLVGMGGGDAGRKLADFDGLPLHVANERQGRVDGLGIRDSGVDGALQHTDERLRVDLATPIGVEPAHERREAIPREEEPHLVKACAELVRFNAVAVLVQLHEDVLNVVNRVAAGDEHVPELSAELLEYLLKLVLVVERLGDV